MAKKIVASERDSKAAEAALRILEDLDGIRAGAWGEELRDRLESCRRLLTKVARPRLSKPLRPH